MGAQKVAFGVKKRKQVNCYDWDWNLRQNVQKEKRNNNCEMGA